MYELIFTSILAAIVTYDLNVNRNQGPVRASAIVGLCFGLSCILLNAYNIVDDNLMQKIPSVAMGASFVGMSSKRVIQNHVWMFAAGGIFSFVFLFSSPLFTGLGGGLGITACVAVVTTLGIMKLCKKLNRGFLKKSFPYFCCNEYCA